MMKFAVLRSSLLLSASALSLLANSAFADTKSSPASAAAPASTPAAASTPASAPAPSPAPAPVPASASAPVPAETYPIELDVDPTSTNLKLIPPVFKYSVQPNVSVGMGAKIIRTDLFRLQLESKGKSHFVLTLPSNFLNQGELKIQATNGEAIWKTNFKRRDLQTQTLKIKDSEFSAYVYQSRALDIELLQRLGGGDFQYCLMRQSSKDVLQFCSAPLVMDRSKADTPQIMPKPGFAAESKIVINGQPVHASGVVQFNAKDANLEFDVSGTAGAYHIKSTPKSLELTDVSLDQNVLTIKGKGLPPQGKNVEVNDDKWSAVLNGNGGILTISASGEIPFSQEVMVLGPLPSKKERVRIRGQNSTYQEKVTFEGQKPADYELTAQEGSVVEKKTDDGQIIWEMQNLQKGQLNQRKLLLKSQKLEFHPYYEIFRGYPYELSTRLTGLLPGGSGIVLVGELAGSAWFERIGKWKHPYLSDRRWGATAQYSKTVIGDSYYNFNTINANLKYRFTSGVWGRDATFGAIAGIQKFQYGTRASVDTMGVGLLWARPMPQVFDEIFNIVPWFRYPKWVDAEFTYQLMTLTNDVKLGSNFKLAFHGKMNITPQYYIEAGFGLLNVDYSNSVTRNVLQLLSVYGTGGIGINF